MSSIYEALQRIQREKDSWSSTVRNEQPRTREKMASLVLVAIVASSLCTAGIFFGIKYFGQGRHGHDRAAVTSEIGAVKPSPSLAEQSQKEGGAAKMPAGTASQAASPESVDDYLKAGEQLFRAKDYDKALLTYTKALHYFRKDVRLLNNIGNVFLAQGQERKAIHYFKQASETSKDYVEPVYNLACAHAKLGKKSAALSYLKKACTMNPEARRWAAEDPDLLRLKGSVKFDQIIGTQEEKGEG